MAMTSLMFGQLSSIGVPADEEVVRSTATPVDINAPAAMQEDMPEPEEVETDHNPNLGMVNRQLASKWFASIRTRPIHQGEVDNNHLHNDIVDSKISTSGTAAAREASGEWGHGTMAYAVGIEPVNDLVDGHKMGNEYFVRHDRPVQEGMGSYMSNAKGPDSNTVGSVAAAGKANSRAAAQASMYDIWWGGGKP
jgi:hypothetical protein